MSKENDVVETEESAGVTGPVEVVATCKREGAEAVKLSCIVDLGTSAEDAISRFGADVVFDGFFRSAKITAQSIMRRLYEAGKSPDEIQAELDAWQPGKAMERMVDPVAAMKKKFASMSPEEQQAFIAELSGQTA